MAVRYIKGSIRCSLYSDLSFLKGNCGENDDKIVLDLQCYSLFYIMTQLLNCKSWLINLCLLSENMGKFVNLNHHTKQEIQICTSGGNYILEEQLTVAYFNSIFFVKVYLQQLAKIVNNGKIKFI